ncbi:hypothetical protein ACFLWA_12735, partial [Chloroflexota bacterium]
GVGERARVGERVAAWLTVGMAEAVAVGERVVTTLVAAVPKAVGVGIEVASPVLVVAACLVAVSVPVGGGGKIGSVAVGSEVALAVAVSGVRVMRANSPLDRNRITPMRIKPAPAPNSIRAATLDQRRNGL